MKKFLNKIIVFCIPFLIWILIVIVVDPFNYFNKINIIDNEAKINAYHLNPLLFNTISYVNNPAKNLLIGDSRTNSLSVDLINSYSKKKYKKLTTNATKMNEILELFHYTNDIKKIEHLVIGVNFSMFNKFSYDDRVRIVKKIIDNPLLYIFSKDVLEASYYVLRSHFFKINVNNKLNISKDDFWNWTINFKGNHWYGKYKYPENLYSELIKFDEYTSENNIKVIFIITPHHRDFYKKLKENNLQNEEMKFKKIMSSLKALVFDFDFENKLTVNKKNFTDPIHYNDSIGRLIVEEIWSKKLVFGKKL